MSRYNICKESLITNIEYAKKKNINIIICLFNTSIRLYTNIKIGLQSKTYIRYNYKKELSLYDNLTYDQIRNYIEESEPNDGTDFLLPFQLLSCIQEINPTSEIFFLSDGYNNKKFTEENINFLSRFKPRVTTLGIGSKSNYDDVILSKLSKTDQTIEGQNAEIIQQELLAQMSDALNDSIDSWTDVEITLMGDVDDLNVGSLMQATSITEDEYQSTFFMQNTENPNLILSSSNNNMMVNKKINIINNDNIEINKEMLIFIIDQSGSMDELADGYNENNYYETDILIEHDKNIYISDQKEELKYMKYTMKLPSMKAYQRIIFSSKTNNFKGCITWKDSSNNKQSMVLHNIFKYTKIDDSNIEKAIDLANRIGHYINIAPLCNNDDNVGNFRKINMICKKNTKFFSDIINQKLIQDYSLIEILFYNRKHGLKLFNSTINKSEQNMHNLLDAASAGGYKFLSAAATMSATQALTPSSQAYNPCDNHQTNKFRDISMCTICYDEIREYVFSCGHCYSCKSCAEKLLDSEPKNKCSYCKEDITWIRKITMTEDQKNKDHYYKCINTDCYNIATIIAKCDSIPENLEDAGYHLTFCEKCYNPKTNKKRRTIYTCFCHKEIKMIVNKVYFN
jgi:hypothetical protein